MTSSGVLETPVVNQYSLTPGVVVLALVERLVQTSQIVLIESVEQRHAGIEFFDEFLLVFKVIAGGGANRDANFCCPVSESFINSSQSARDLDHTLRQWIIVDIDLWYGKIAEQCEGHAQFYGSTGVPIADH